VTWEDAVADEALGLAIKAKGPSVVVVMETQRPE